LEAKLKQAQARPDILTRKDLYEYAKENGEITYARSLLTKIQRYAREFSKISPLD